MLDLFYFGMNTLLLVELMIFFILLIGWICCTDYWDKFINAIDVDMYVGFVVINGIVGVFDIMLSIIDGQRGHNVTLVIYAFVQGICLVSVVIFYMVVGLQNARYYFERKRGK